jgi:hypothetical protein
MEVAEVRVTLNNDVRVLRGCKMLLREIEYLNGKIRQESELLTGRGTPISDMPRGCGEPRDTYDEWASIETLKGERRYKILEYTRQVQDAERILAAVSNPMLRYAYRLLFVEGLPAWKVGREIEKSERYVDDVKAKAERSRTLAEA